MEVFVIGENHVSTAPSVATIAVAINDKRNCKPALKWALEKFASEGRFLFKLLHICLKITMVPTGMGNYLPISKVRDEVASAYKNEMEWRTNAMLLPYKQMCSQKQVEAEAVVIEADDVPEAISVEIVKFSIGTLVIGASSCSLLRRMSWMILVLQLMGLPMSAEQSTCG